MVLNKSAQVKAGIQAVPYMVRLAEYAFVMTKRWPLMCPVQYLHIGDSRDFCDIKNTMAMPRVAWITEQF